MNLYGLRKYACNLEQAKEVKFDEYINDIRFDSLEIKASSKVPGYIRKGTRVIIPYDGKYGVGYIVCEPSYNPYNGKVSTKYMAIHYWTEKKEVL